ncbi:uncharacterized protein LOC118646752 [Monomorium pharaonis]|uniref:uncharacterized protein LOC118646752 n=1 Tax=Monomorium pharaonis TaxID=307658 RepID=UPI0017461E41|nr:uncharacterized protein LOC118646752 [Monomorium pharaonis]
MELDMSDFSNGSSSARHRRYSSACQRNRSSSAYQTIVPPSASTTAPPLPSANTAAPRIDTSVSSQMRFLRPGTTTAPRASSHTNQSWRPRGTRAGMRRKARNFFNFLFNMSDLYGRHYYQRRGGRRGGRN